MLPTAVGPLACVILCTCMYVCMYACMYMYNIKLVGNIFPSVILYSFFSFLLFYGVLGVGVLLLGAWIGLFVDEGFQLMGLWHLE